MWDLVLAVLAIVALVAVASRLGFGPPRPASWLVGPALAALVIVLYLLIDPPPLTPEIDGDPSTGLWLALACRGADGRRRAALRGAHLRRDQPGRRLRRRPLAAPGPAPGRAHPGAAPVARRARSGPGPGPGGAGHGLAGHPAAGAPPTEPTRPL